MASVQLDGGKHTTKQATSAHIPHDFRERENYSNKDIDKDLTYLNETYGCSTGMKAREKLLSRIAECDAFHPPKRYKADRKTSLEMHIPAPRENLSYEQLRTFFRKAYANLEDMFGKENVIYGVTHFDETHKFLNPDDGKYHMSREGLHVVIVPWTEKDGLNMHSFYRRTLPTKINKMLDKTCQEVFGFDYQDGTKISNKAKVEKLKETSAKAEESLSENYKNTAFMEQISEMRIKENQKRLDSMDVEYKAKKKKHDELDADNQKLQAENEKLKADNLSIKKASEETTTAAQLLMQQVQQKETDAETLMNDARAKAKEQDEKGKKFQIWQDGLEAQQKVLDSEKAKLKADKEAFRDEKANEYAKIDERVAKEIAIEKSKMKKSWIAHKEKWEADKTAQNEKWRVDTEEKLRKENQIVLDTALKEQVKDVKKYHEWQSRERAKQAVDDIDFSGSKQKERSL